MDGFDSAQAHYDALEPPEEEELDQLSVDDALEAGRYDRATQRYYYNLANNVKAHYEKQQDSL
jgi:hypothetical protein|tara:strand:- start:983 stop:1171 length:189 start_codon:yes stop_codon:yes gene_type:complete